MDLAIRTSSNSLTNYKTLSIIFFRKAENFSIYDIRYNSISITNAHIVLNFLSKRIGAKDTEEASDLEVWHAGQRGQSSILKEIGRLF